ncbi:hypothetical protein Bpfe_012990 [Biomphalaria pfeifferi]|uniref:Uncharacterized protein n=1 Tax=Biomphalaria pfeifferi TaxID=112525 RepID=A0AAD8BNV3_BIOPF|nr:hypothetical protein Bpfe_012990 [Biomphalaria pfeifferi]
MFQIIDHRSAVRGMTVKGCRGRGAMLRGGHGKNKRIYQSIPLPHPNRTSMKIVDLFDKRVSRLNRRLLVNGKEGGNDPEAPTTRLLSFPNKNGEYVTVRCAGVSASGFLVACFQFVI